MLRTLKNSLSLSGNEKFLSFSNVFIMTVVFFFLSVFITIEVVSQTVLNKLQQEAQVTVYFKEDFPTDKILELKQKSEQDQRVLSVKYVSKEDAFNIYKELTKDEPILTESLSASALPASLEIKTKNIENLANIAKEYEKTDGVDGVKYFEEIVQRFIGISRVVSIVILAVALAFIFMSFAIVVATVRVALSSRKEEFEILKLVGADDNYVKKPLIMQALFFGGFSGVISWVIFCVVFLAVIIANVLKFIGTENLVLFRGLQISSLVYVVIMLFILVFFGAGLGFIASKTTISKYLKY